MSTNIDPLCLSPSQQPEEDFHEIPLNDEGNAAQGPDVVEHKSSRVAEVEKRQLIKNKSAEARKVKFRKDLRIVCRKRDCIVATLIFIFSILCGIGAALALHFYEVNNFLGTGVGICILMAFYSFVYLCVNNPYWFPLEIDNRVRPYPAAPTATSPSTATAPVTDPCTSATDSENLPLLGEVSELQLGSSESKSTVLDALSPISSLSMSSANVEKASTTKSVAEGVKMKVIPSEKNDPPTGEDSLIRETKISPTGVLETSI